MSKGWQQHKDKEISGSDKNLIKGRQNGPYRSMLQEAVDAVLGSFAKHTKGSGKGRYRVQITNNQPSAGRETMITFGLGLAFLGT